MKQLLLLRHAKSAWPDGVDDHDRPLAERGRRDAPRMGAHMAATASSPIVRWSPPPAAHRKHGTSLRRPS